MKYSHLLQRVMLVVAVGKMPLYPRHNHAVTIQYVSFSHDTIFLRL